LAAPPNARFTKTHEWAALNGDTATVGITDFAVQLLSDLVYVDLPKPGRKVTAGEPFGEIESVKHVSDLYSPVTGEVVEVNTPLADKLEWLSSDPFGQGWMIKVKVAGPQATDGLLDAAAYEAHCQTEGH
jgi:glycine cleavage system H protein